MSQSDKGSVDGCSLSEIGTCSDIFKSPPSVRIHNKGVVASCGCVPMCGNLSCWTTEGSGTLNVYWVKSIA
jgi:hypothetical protein